MADKTPKTHGPLIKMEDYVRIHAVIHAVLEGLDARTTKACIFFSVAGAYLLQRHHGLDARPMAGAALYCVGGDPPGVLTYARFEDNGLVSDDDSFHCWVECSGWAIDFMAPLFGDILNSLDHGIKAPRKMFQRRLSTMVKVEDPFDSAGQFLLLGNKSLTNDILNRAMSKPSTGDLVEICVAWYRRAPKRIDDRFTIGSDDGSIHSLRLSPPSLAGSW